MQTLAEAQVVFANTRYVIQVRSGVLRYDSRSVYKLENSVTLPRLDDRRPDWPLQRQFSSIQCGAETWKLKKYQTFACGYGPE